MGHSGSGSRLCPFNILLDAFLDSDGSLRLVLGKAEKIEAIHSWTFELRS